MSSAILLKASRTSGAPFYQADQDALKEAIRANFDKIMLKLNVDPKKIPEKEVAERANKLLTRTERIIAARYPVEVQMPLFYSKEDWVEAINTYGALVLTIQNGELRYYVFDSEMM